MYKVLVLDDEKYIRKAILNLVDWNSCDTQVVGEAAGGEEALHFMDTEKLDIVLVDIRMRGMDGLEFIEKAQKKFSKVSYIILSAYSDFKYARKALQLGVEDYVLKPVQEEDVEKVLKKVIQKKREEWLRIRIHRQETEWISEKEIKEILPHKRVAATAFYLTDEQKETEIEISVRNYVKKSGEHIAVYMLRDLEACTIALINGEAIEEADLIKMIHFVWKEVQELPHRAAYSSVYDRQNALSAIRQAENALKKKGGELTKCVVSDATETKNNIDEIKGYVNEHFSEHLSASGIGAHFHYAPAYLSALFKEQAGINLTTYIENVRMEWAKHYLDLREMSITDVALKTGYSDVSYFSKVFKKYTGVSPREYKKENQ